MKATPQKIEVISPFEDRAAEWLARLSGKPELTEAESDSAKGILDGTTVHSSVSPRASARRSAAIPAGLQGVPFLWFVSLGTQRNEQISTFLNVSPLLGGPKSDNPLGYLINFASTRLYYQRIILTNDRKPFLKVSV